MMQQAVNPSRAERRRRSASKARFSSPFFGEGLDHRPWANAKTARGMLACQNHAGAAGAVFAQSFRTPPGGGMQRKSGLPRAERRTGAMMRVWTTTETPGGLTMNKLKREAPLPVLSAAARRKKPRGSRRGVSFRSGRWSVRQDCQQQERDDVGDR
jgi:hypothetical protein